MPFQVDLRKAILLIFLPVYVQFLCSYVNYVSLDKRQIERERELGNIL